MGASVSASHVIFMVAAIIAASAVGAAMIGIAFTLAEDLSDNSEKLSESMGTDIKLVNDPAMMLYDPNDELLFLYVLNNGDRSLDDTGWIVIINGQLIPDASVTPVTASPYRNGDVAVLMVGVDLSPGDHTVMVRYGSMADDSLRFRVI